MVVWKNGRNTAFVYGEYRLTPGQARQAVNSMSYCGLQTAAASFFCAAKSSD